MHDDDLRMDGWQPFAIAMKYKYESRNRIDLLSVKDKDVNTEHENHSTGSNTGSLSDAVVELEESDACLPIVVDRL